MENKIAQYKGLELNKESAKEVSEQELNQALQDLLTRSVSLVSKEGKSVEGDTVNIDFEGFVDDVAFEGGKGESYDLELGSHTFIPGFEEQLIGYEAGDEVNVNVTFPENYQAENLKGKPAVFKCKVNEVKVKKVPSLDDAFAKENGLDNVEELRGAMKAQLQHRAEAKAYNDYIEKVLAFLAENSEVELTQEHLDSSMENMIAYYEQMVAQYGMTLQQYLEMAKKSFDDFKKTIMPEVEKGAKINFVLDYIAKEENIVCSEEELNAELTRLSKYYQLNEEQLKQFKDSHLKDFENEIIKQKVSHFLYENNN